MTPPESVTAAWAACEEHWDDAARHDAFFALAAQYDCFAYAASKYKPRAGDAAADRALDRIRKAAVAKMMASSTAHVDPHKSKPYRATLALIVLMLVAALAGLAYVANMRHR
jgi:hypothetical protein